MAGLKLMKRLSNSQKNGKTLSIEIIWSDLAIDTISKIYDYHLRKVNQSIAAEIRDKIFDSIELLFSNPQIGQIESTLEVRREKHRYLITGNYKILYRVDKKKVFIDDIFDTRRDPNKMMKNNRDE